MWFDELSRSDIGSVGGKNASLGELTHNLGSEAIAVPPGFATTAAAFWSFVSANGLADVIERALAAYRGRTMTLAEAGRTLRCAFLRGTFPEPIAEAIGSAYRQLSARCGAPALDVAVRSSATAEDLPDASFAGQHESFLNIRGEDALLDACRRCYASLFTDRAIRYREAKGFDRVKVALSVGVQKMVRSDQGGAGVMFSIDTETGCDRVVLINAAWGLGENVVQGSVDPDEYQVFKPLLANPALTPIIEKRCGEKALKLVYSTSAQTPTQNLPTSAEERASFVLSDTEILSLARWGCAIERHYGTAMDIEWARDGGNGPLYVVQARPETVYSRRAVTSLKSYRVARQGRTLIKGFAVGNAAVTGRVCALQGPGDIQHFVDGAILVTGTTDPDWVPIMKRASAIVTDHGGRTSHAAIVSRELGLPAVVGTGNATALLHDGQEITVSCAQGEEGFVYEGTAEIAVTETDLSTIPATRTQVMLNLANPAAALRWWRMPADGVGLARMEFVISSHIRIHPMALIHYAALQDVQVRQSIEALTAGYGDKCEYFIDKLSRSLARIAAALYPKPVIIRTSDFKTNEYANLIGGREFEPQEANPMLGLRGASRYYSARYREGFALECRALRRLRDELGFNNVIVMIPFCRSPREADRVLQVMAQNGLVRGENGLQVYVMCEIPSNVILAHAFAARFDGFSIGSNDLTQLTLGVDRDCEELAGLFDEQDEAVKWMIRNVIAEAHRTRTKVGLCGQAPSDHPEFAEFLVDCGIDSLSVSPDSFVEVKRRIATMEAAARRAAV